MTLSTGERSRTCWMLNNRWLRITAVLATLVLSFANKAFADIVYPSRLELTEVEQDIFEVRFVLPVIQGKVLKAQPVLPAFCERVTDPLVDGDYNSKVVTWTVRCDADSLNGKQIGIEGLSGSQVDVLLIVKTGSGREYKTTLSAVNAYYVIPATGGMGQLFGRPVITGMRLLLTSGALYLLLLVTLFHNASLRTLLVAAGCFLLAHLSGHLFSQHLMNEIAAARPNISNPWLPVPEYLDTLVALITALLLALPLASGHSKDIRMAMSVSIALLLGATAGIEVLDINEPQGLSDLESNWYLLFVNLGIGLGLVLAWMTCIQGKRVLELISKRPNRIIGYMVGALSAGWLIYEGATLINYPSLLPSMPIEVLLATIAVALWLSSPGRSNAETTVAILVSFISGIALGNSALQFSLGFEVLMACALWFLIARLFAKELPTGLGISLLIVLGLATGFHLSHEALDSLSYPAVHIAVQGLVVLLTGLLTMYIASEQNGRPGRPSAVINTATIICCMAALGIIALSFAKNVLPEIQNALATGSFFVPLISFALLLIALLAWPRSRRIHREMSLHRKSPYVSIVLIAITLAFSSVGWSISNPWYTPHAPSEYEARRVFDKLLWQTYSSFNIPDEELLYESLSETVSSELIDDLYLDSRRRFITGLREGSEVSIEEVEVVGTGPPESSSLDIDSHSYPVEWVVTARVRHLQHVHFRQNRYVGIITITHESDQWKISNITLKSEDRTVLAASQR